MDQRTFRAFVDRIEGGMVVLLVGEHEQREMILPRDLLPPGAQPGSVISITISRDSAGTADVSRQVDDLIDKLTGEPDG